MNQTNYGLKAKFGVGDYFIFFALKNLVEHLRQQSYGTIFDTITTKTFQSTLHILPTRELLKIFDEFAKPFMAMMLNHVTQSQEIISIRDALLPRLISGEIQVKDRIQ